MQSGASEGLESGHPGTIFALDAESVEGASAASQHSSESIGHSEEQAFWAELQQVLGGQQLGRQFRRVLLDPSHSCM